MQRLTQNVLALMLFAWCFFIIPFVEGQGGLYAQSFPVQVIPQATPPPPIYFSDYADESTVNSPLRVQLILNDFEIANREVRLRTYFEGGGIAFQSNEGVVGASPLFLDGGVPLVLTNVELAPYFRFENISGISPNVYGQAIPEGAYQFCFEVYDVLTGNRLSQKSCVTSVVFQNEPPFLISPRNKINVEEFNPQNIVFQWTPRHINVTNVEYELSIVEIWDTQVDPQAAFLSSPPVFQTTTTATTYAYGPADPLFLSGKNYAWRVQAKAKQGIEEIGLFENQGYSEIYSFSYAGNCDLPTGINHEVKGSTNANIFWDDFSTDIPEYIVRYRKASGSAQNGANEWFMNKTTTNQTTLWDLKAGTTYEYQIQKKCTVTGSDWSLAKQFTTFIADDVASVYECGITPDFSLSNKEPLPNISSGDKFTAGDFPITISQVSGSNGRFTGKGYVRIPYLNSIKVSVEFTNVLLNTDKQLAEGTVVTKYDPDAGGILDIDEAIETADTVTDLVSEPFEGDNDLDEIRVNWEIDSEKDIEIKDGMVIITNPANGATITEPLGDDMVVIDKEGKTYHIDAGGNITEGGQIDSGGAVTSNNVEGVSNNGDIQELTAKGIVVTFESANGDFGYDEMPQLSNPAIKEEYTTIKDGNGDDYTLIHQAVEKGKSAKLIAKVDQSGSQYALGDIIFKTQQGETIPAKVSGNSIELTLTGSYTFENEIIYAVVPSEEDNRKQLTAGAFTLWHMTDRVVDVVLVSVNGANIPNSIGADIRRIFKKGVTTVNVSTDADNNQLDLSLLGGNGKLDIGESAWLTNYNDEQKAVISNLKSQISYDRNTYYILVFGNDVQPTKPIGGFMPLQRQFGFVFNGDVTADEEGKGNLAKTIAHELGHGVFSLRHPFIQYGSGQESTNWLMDYANGSLLSHMDWAQLHNPELKFYVFQDDEDGEIAGKIWFTPDWRPFLIKNSSIIISNIANTSPRGTIPGFKLNNGTEYWAKYHTNGTFKGYYDEIGNEIIDTEYQNKELTISDDDVVHIFEYIPNDCNRIFSAKYEYVQGNKNSLDLTFLNSNVSLVDIAVNCPNNLCNNGREFYDTYVASTTSNKERESLLKVSKLICQKGDGYYNALISQLNKNSRAQRDALFYNEYQYLYDLGKESFWSESENPWERYANALIDINELFVSQTDVYARTNPDDLFFLLNYCTLSMLKQINTDYKVTILGEILRNETFITDGTWLSFFSETKDEEGLIIKLLSSIESNEANEFLDKIKTYHAGDEKIIVKLIEQIDDNLGRNHFTALNQILFGLLIESEGGVDQYIEKYANEENVYPWLYEEDFWIFIRNEIRYSHSLDDNGKLKFKADFVIRNEFNATDEDDDGNDIKERSINCLSNDCSEGGILSYVQNNRAKIYKFENFVPETILNDPYEVILIEFSSDVDLDGNPSTAEITAGSILPVPAFFFKYVLVKNGWTILERDISDVTTIATSIFAARALFSGARGLTKLIASMTIFFNTTKPIFENKDVIYFLENETDLGSEFLVGYRTLSLLNTLAGTLNAPSSATRLAGFMSTYFKGDSIEDNYFEDVGKPFSEKFPNEFNRIIEEINRLN